MYTTLESTQLRTTPLLRIINLLLYTVVGLQIILDIILILYHIKYIVRLDDLPSFAKPAHRFRSHLESRIWLRVLYIVTPFIIPIC